MARVKTDVDVNVKSTGAKRAAKDLSSVGAALKKVGQETNTATAGSEKLNRSTTRLGQASASTGRQFSAQAQGLGGLVGAYAGAAATIFALQQAFSALNRAAQAENIIRGTQTLAAQIGENGDKIISSLQGITQGQLSMVEAAEKANMALASGFNTDQIERLTNVAQKASRALGRNLNEAFERLVRGAAKLEPELLDELGIFTRLDPAVDAYAKQLNKASNELTSFERRQAFVNAVIEEGERKFSAIDTTAPSAQKSLEQLSTTLSDLGTKFGILLANSLVPVAEFFTKDISLALSAFALVARQVSQVGFAMMGNAANQAAQNLQTFANTTVANAISTQKSKNSLVSMNSALTEMDRTFARGSLNQVKAAQAMFATMRAGEVTVDQLSEAQKILEQQIKNTNIALDAHRTKLAQLQAQNKASDAVTKKLKASIRQGEKDLDQYRTALEDVKQGTAAQTKSVVLLTGATRVFGVVAKGVSLVLRGFMAALSGFLLVAAFGPIILKLAGQIEFLNNIIEKVSGYFKDIKTSVSDVQQGMSTLAADSSIDEITQKYIDLGLSADQAANNQRAVVERLQEIGVAARNVGFIADLRDRATNIPLIGRLFEREEIDADLQVARDIAEEIKNLRYELMGLKGTINPEEALNLRQQLDSFTAINNALGQTSIFAREFASSLSRITGMDAIKVLDTIKESADGLSISIKGVTVGVRNNLTDAFSLANASAADLMTQFVGFQTVLTDASNALTTIGTPPKELIAFGQQLTNSQANLNRALEVTKVRLADVYDRYRIAEAQVRTAQGADARSAAEARLKAIEFERQELEAAYKATSAVLRRDEERLERLKLVSAELEKQSALYDEMKKNFGSEISAFENYELQGQFSIGEDGSLQLATSQVEVAANRVQYLIDKVTQFKSESVQTLSEITSELSTTFSDPFEDAEGNIVKGFDKATESVFDFVDRVKGSKIENEDLAAAVAQVVAMEQNLETAAKAVLGTFMQQIKSAKDLVVQVKQLDVRLRRSAATKAAQASINAAKAELSFEQKKFQLQNEEAQLSNRILNAEYEGRKIALDSRKEDLKMNDAILAARQEALEIEREMAQLRIDAAKFDLETGQKLLDFGNQGIQDNDFFGDTFKQFSDIITELGNASLNIGIADKDIEKADTDLSFIEQQAALDQERIANRIELDQIETEQRMLELQLDRENIDFRYEMDVKALNFRLKQVEVERKIAITRALLDQVQRNFDRARIGIEISMLEKKIRDTIEYIKASQKFIKDLKQENTHFLQNFKMIADNLAQALGAGPSGPISQRQEEVEAAQRAEQARADQAQRDANPFGYNVGQVDPGFQAALEANTAASRELPSSVSDAMTSPAVTRNQGQAIGDSVYDFISKEEGGYGTGKTYWDEKQTSGPYGMAMAPGTQMGREEAYAKFEGTVDKFAGAVDNLDEKYGYNFNENQKAALTSFAYNLGENALEQVTDQGKRNTQQISDAMSQYYNVESNDQRKEAALRDRRAREIALFNGESSARMDSAATNMSSAAQMMTQASEGLQNLPGPVDTSALSGGTGDVYQNLGDAEVMLGDLRSALQETNALEEQANQLINDLRMQELDITEESVKMQLAQRKALYEQEVRNNLNLQKLAKKAGDNINALGLIESANAANKAALERAKTMEKRRQAQIAAEFARMEEAQKSLVAFGNLGGFLEKIAVNDAQDELDKAEENYKKALESRKDAVEKYQSSFEKYSNAVEKGFDIIEKRRELEQKYLDTVGLGTDGAKAYYEIQKELLESIQKSSDQTENIKKANIDRTADTVKLVLAEYELATAADKRSAAERKLSQGWRRIVGDIGKTISKVGELGSALISLSNVIAGLTRVSGQGGGIFGSILGAFGFDPGSSLEGILKGLPKMLGDAVMAPFKILGMTDGGITSGADGAKLAIDSINKIVPQMQTFMNYAGGAVMGASVAGQAFSGADPQKAMVLGGIGGALGTYVGSMVAASLATTQFGAQLGAALGPVGMLVGGLLGGLLGGLFADWFTKTKSSGATINLASGGRGQYGDKGGNLAPLADLAGQLAEITEDVVGSSIKGTFGAYFSYKGRDVKRKEMVMSVGGRTYSKGISDDPDQVAKDIFELITKGFADVNNADIALAMSRLNFDQEIEENLAKIDFAAKFGDILQGLGSYLKGGYVTVAEEIDVITATTAANIDELTGGLMSNYRKLKKEAMDVFGAQSAQVRRLDNKIQDALLAEAGIFVDLRGNVSLIEREAESLNNMAIIFAQIEGETKGFRDALIETGMAAAEADRILEETVELKLIKVAEDFYESLSRADKIASGIDPKVFEDTAEIFKYQEDLIRDAQTIQDKFPAQFSDAVTKAEDLAQKQRLKMVAEASDEQLSAIRELTSVTGEFADTVTQAAVQAEIAARTLLSVFNTSELQKAARRSETRLSFNFASVGLAAGGPVPGTGAQQNKDSVPAMLMPGEYVINKESAKRLGYGTLDALNSGNFKQMAAGGAVQTDIYGGSTTTGGLAGSFAAYEFDGDAAMISFAEAANILTDANEGLYDSYLDLVSSANTNTNFNRALEEAQEQLADGNILLSRAIFEYTTGIRAARSVTESYNQIIAENRTADLARSAGLITNIQSFGEFTAASNDFFEAIQTPKDYLQQSEGLYKKLYKAQNELNKLLSQGTITSDEYNSAVESLNAAYQDSIDKVKEYNDFFIDLNDGLDMSGALTQVRDLVTTYLDGFDMIKYAVEDGVIDTVDAYQKEIEINKLYNKQRLDLVENATEEQLKVLRDAQTNAEDYAGGVATIIDFTYQAGAAAELLTRQLNAVSKSFSSMQVSLVDFYNSTIDSIGGFGSRLVKSVESVFLEAGVEFDDGLANFYGAIGPFAVAAQRGSASLASLNQAVGELNYQLQTSEEIDIETYKTGISILQDSFMDFINTFQEMRDELTSTSEAMADFGNTLYDEFNAIQDNITRLIEGMVSSYRSNFDNLKGLFDDAVAKQGDAEEELFNTLFAAQKAFESAGGNLSGHVDRIDDIVKGLDPAYTGYAGLDQYLLDLRTDIENGTAAIADIDVAVPLSQLQANLQTELAALSALQALPDSADKFVRVSRQLSKIADIEEQISQAQNASDALKESALALVDVERELNQNNLSANLENIDLTTTEIYEDLAKRAVEARAAFNDANAVLDGYNAALATNTTYVNGLADVVPSVNDQIANFTTRLADVSAEFANVQQAIADVTAAGLTDSLDNIVFDTDAYNIDVQPFSDSAKILADLNQAISDYQDIVDAKNAYEALYGAIGVTATTLPIDEFNELNTTLTTLETNLLAAAQASIDPTITAISEIDDKFKQFILDAIALFETPIQLDIIEPNTTSTTSVAAYTVGTGNTATTQYGTAATNAILQQILTQGLGVQSPGYLYYANLFLEDIKDILSEMLLLQGGTLPTLNDPTVTPAVGSGTGTSGTVYAGPDYSNLSGLTGQLFSVQEPIALPADYFYIVVPQIIKLLDLIEIVDNEIALDDLITIVKEEHNIYEWVDITKSEETWETFFTIKTIESKITDWLDITKTESKFEDWITIVKQDHDYRTWFNQPSTVDTNALKWFVIKQSETTWDAWYAPPTLTETSFYDWLTISEEKASTSAYDWFEIEQKAIKYIDFFDVSEKINAVEFIEKTTVESGDFFNISTTATEFADWFSIASKDALTFNDFFDGIAKGDASTLGQWFELEDPLGLTPDQLYTVGDAIEKEPSAYYTIGDAVEKSPADFVSFTGVLSVDPADVINVNELNKITVSYPDVFKTDTETLLLTDMFDNYDVNGGFDFTKAKLDSKEIIDLDYLKENGFDNKLKLAAGDLVSNAADGALVVEDSDKFRVDFKDFFVIDKIELRDGNLLEEFYTLTSDKIETDFYDWFAVQDKIDIKNIFEVFEAIPLDLANAFTLSNTREPIAPSQVFTLSPNPTTVSASQLFEINQKQKVTGDEAFEFVKFELAASDLIDFDYLKEKPLQIAGIDAIKVKDTLELKASDVLSVSNKLTLDAVDALTINKSNWDAKDIIGWNEFTVDVNDLVVLGDPVKAPGSSFYAISAPTALPASTFIGVDENNKITLGYADVFDTDDKVKFTLGEIFDNYANGEFDWVKTALAVTDVIDLETLSTSGLAEKVTLKTSDIIDNIDGSSLELSNKIDLSVATFYSDPTLQEHDITTWYKKPTQQDTNFDEWFIMNDNTKLDLSYLVNNSVPLDYNDVFNYDYTTKIRLDEWDFVFFLDESKKITKKSNDIFDVVEGTYNAVDLIKFDPLETTVSTLISTKYLEDNKLKLNAGSLVEIGDPIEKNAAALLNIAEPLAVDLNKNVTFEPVVIDGKEIYIAEASEIAGNRLFTPTQFEITGAAFFTPIAASIDANDLFIIDKKVPIDVSATFESDFAEMQTTLDSILDLTKTNEHNTSENAKDTATAIYDQIFDYYQNTFLKSYYDQWTSDFAKLPDILAGVKTANGLLEDIKTGLEDANTTLTSIDGYSKTTAEQTTAAETTLDVIEGYTKITSEQTTAAETTLDVIEGYAKITSEETKAAEETLNSILVHADALPYIKINTKDTVGYVKDIELNTDDLPDMATTLTDIKELVKSMDLTLFNIQSGTDYIDDMEKTLREQIHLQDFAKLIDINAQRYTYTGATATRLPGYKEGGLVQGAGTGTSDSIHAKLSNGEFVMKANAVSSLGTGLLDKLNKTGDLGAALASLGVRGDTEVAHINKVEAALLKALGGSGTTNMLTGLRQFFFDGVPTRPSKDATDTLDAAGTNYVDVFNKRDGYPQWLYTNNAASYTYGYNAQNIAKAVSGMIKTASYAKGDGLKYVHKNWHRISDYIWGQWSTNPGNWSEFGYDWNDWNNSINASNMGNPSTLAGTYQKKDLAKLTGNVWNTWGVTSDNITAEGAALAAQYGISGFANGGLVSGPGTSVSDSIMAMLSDGEYVVRNSSVDSVGANNLEYINRTGNLPQGDTNVEVNITNNGQPVDVQSEPTVRLDGDKIVVDVVLKDLRTNGPIKRAIKKVK